MPFIGNQPTSGRFLELDSLTASATDDYTLQLNGANFSPESVNNLLVSINGVIQGSSTMSLNGAVLTVGATLSSSDTIDFVRVFGNVGTVSTPTDGSVTANKIGTGAVTSAKIADGTIVNSDINASAGIVGSKLGTGAVLDVYQHTSITQSGANATSNYNSTGLFLTITPKSTSSKFLLTFNGAVHNNTANGYVVANISLNPTSSTNVNTVVTGGTLLTTQAYGMAHVVINVANYRVMLSGSILHAPNTTSPVTYNVVFKRESAGNAYWAVSNGLTSLTAMEIGG